MSDRETNHTTQGRYLADEGPEMDAEYPEPMCETTGDEVRVCDCGDCYFLRHEEPKPCSECGGVGCHMSGCY